MHWCGVRFGQFITRVRETYITVDSSPTFAPFRRLGIIIFPPLISHLNYFQTSFCSRDQLIMADILTEDQVQDHSFDQDLINIILSAL